MPIHKDILSLYGQARFTTFGHVLIAAFRPAADRRSGP